MIAGAFEAIFLFVASSVAALGAVHTRTYYHSQPSFVSDTDLDRYQEYVRLQMWCAVILVCSMVPAVLCGIYFTWTTPGLIAYLPILGYWIPTLIGKGTKSLEEQLRAASITDPRLRERHEFISLVWKKRFLPRF